jgi:itaconate CoA-transferase
VGLASITGGPEAPARVGVSVCDVGSGMNAHAAVLEALLARRRTGQGAAISISLFDSMADWMAIALMLQEGGQPPRRLGLTHTSIAPYGVFKTKEGTDVLISIQNDREWRLLAERVLDDPRLAADPDFATVPQRTARRSETDERVARVFSATDARTLIAKLEAADIAFALVNDVAGLAQHPHLRRISVDTPTGPASYSAPAMVWAGETRSYGRVPSLGEHTDRVRQEFLGAAARSAAAAD